MPCSGCSALHGVNPNQKIDNGLYVSHLQNVIADTSKKVDRATVKGKLKKVCNVNVLLCCAFLTDIPTPAKNAKM